MLSNADCLGDDFTYNQTIILNLQSNTAYKCDILIYLPARHFERIPRGRRGSIRVNMRAGEGTYSTSMHPYTDTKPSGQRMPYDAAFILADTTRLPPALSPTRHSLSPVQPATDQLDLSLGPARNQYKHFGAFSVCAHSPTPIFFHYYFR